MSTFSELIDFTRSSTGTYLDSVVYGDELVTNGTFDTDSDWDKQNGWSINDGEAVYANGTGREILQISIPTVAGKTYKVEFDITSRVVGAVGAYSLESVQNSATYKSTVGPYVRFLTATGSVMALRIRSSAVSANLSIDNVSLKEVTSTAGGTPLLRTADTNEPRLEYDASGQPLGLLIEEQRTNQMRYSNSLSGSSWQGTNCSITTDSTTSPDGSINASKLTCSVDGGSSSVWQYAIATGLNGNYSNSIYLKADTLNYAQLNVGYLTSSFVANFDLVNGTVTDILGTGATITDVGNGWFRCTLPFNTTSQGGFGVTPIDSMSSTRRSGAVGSVFVYGAQLEQGAFPTSYIPTSGSTVTRNADIPSLPIERFSYNDTQGTLFAEFEHNAVNSSASFLVSDNTLNNRIQLTSRQTGTSGATAFISASGTTQTAFSASYNFIAGNKSTLAYKLNDCATTMNGYSVNADTSVTIPTVTTVYIGNINGGAKINGHIKRIQYFPKRLSNDKLVELTKPSSSPTMSLTFDGQATSELVEGLHD